VFARMALDTKNAPGEPSGRLQALANTFLASGLEHDSPERKRKTIDVLAAFAAKLEMKEEDYESPAEFYAAVLAEALTSDRLVVLGKTYLRKGRQYTDKQTGKPAVSQDRVEMGDWTDATEENLEKFGIAMWEVTI
jgi:hypothetical protein